MSLEKESVPMKVFKKLYQHEEGQGLAEVALILALVVVVAIVALQLLGTNITSVLTSVANAI